MDQNNYHESRILKEKAYLAEVYMDYFNKRLRLDDYCGNITQILTKMNEIATSNSFSKIIAKVRSEHISEFLRNGYVLEGILKGYFKGSDAFALSKFYDFKRRNSVEWVNEDNILNHVYLLNSSSSTLTLSPDLQVRKAESLDAKNLAALYQEVFRIYPTPLHDSEYIEEVMEAGTIFYLIEKDGQVVSAASAEINKKYHHAELTDCATQLPFRKDGLMKVLLKMLEKELFQQQIYATYSIARALSFGMNAAFWQLGYQYMGRFANNCYIFDKLEDMNIWVKDLSQQTLFRDNVENGTA